MLKYGVSMFVEYICHYSAPSTYIYTVIDADFEHSITIQVHDKGTTEELRGKIFDLFVEVYEARKLNVGANAAKMIRLLRIYWSSTFIENFQPYSKKYAQYKEDIE